MNASTAIPATIEIRRSRLLWLVCAVGVLAAAVTWSLVAVAFDGGSGGATRVQAPVVVPASSAAQDAARVPSVMDLTPAELAGGALGTGYALPSVEQGPTLSSVLASMTPSTGSYTQAIAALTFRQLAAGAAGSP